MSTVRTGSAKAPERPKYQPTGRPGGGPMGGPRPAEKSLNFLPSLRRLLTQLRPERTVLLAAIGLAVAGIAMSVLGPRILGQATDIIFAGVRGPAPIDFAALGNVLVLALGLYVVSSLCLLLQGYLLNGAVQRSVYRLRREVEAKMNRLPLAYFDRQTRGELLSRVTNDIDNVAQALQQTLSQLLTSLLTVVGVAVMMFVVSPVLAIIALVTIPVSVLVTAAIGKRSQRLFVAQWKATGELNSQVEEAFTGQSLVKVFGRRREVEAVFAGRNEAMFKASFGAQFISGLIMPTMMFVGNLNYVVIAVVGALRVAGGAMSLGDVQAFIQYSRQFTQPLTQVASMANLLQSGVASAERVFEVLDEPEESAEATGQAHPTRGRVAFEHVSFSYPDRAAGAGEEEHTGTAPPPPLISDLSLVVEPGATVAIVGPTGAGKTTLVNLMMRFYELQGGAITLDGVDIATLPRSVLRSRIGMVLQDTWLFHGSIRDNIAYGRPEATPAEITAAAEATYVDRFVRSLPEGYDTVIDEEGSNVSAGEKQLITIARAFLADPSLLILDEATSSVDTRTEVLVQHAMAALRSGTPAKGERYDSGDGLDGRPDPARPGRTAGPRTSFVIAHRLSTIRDADVILVMESGAIVEQGSHEELLERRGAYFTLYNSQFAGAIETGSLKT